LFDEFIFNFYMDVKKIVLIVFDLSRLVFDYKVISYNLNCKIKKIYKYVSFITLLEMDCVLK
jgi:hypothetical protein